MIPIPAFYTASPPKFYLVVWFPDHQVPLASLRPMRLITEGLNESRAKAAALEFLIHCQSTGVTPTIAALNKWAHC